MIAILFFIYYFNIASASRVSCNNAQSCIGRTFNVWSLDANGYQSAYGPTTSLESGTYFNCHGASSCESMWYTNASLASCNGESSCANVPDLFGENIWCMGAESCINSTITGLSNVNSVLCRGLRSCAYANISNSSDIEAEGMLSLMESYIIAPKIGRMDISFDGSYSGYNAIVTCESNKACRLSCNTNDACIGLQCFGNCDLNLTKTVGNYIDFSQFFPELFLDLNTLCNASSADNYQGSDSVSLTIANDDSYCCRGSFGCSNSNILTQKGNMVCSGRLGCQSTSIFGALQTIYCSGASGCLKSSMAVEPNLEFTETTVICSGYRSCDEMALEANQTDLVCAGDDSCTASTFSMNSGANFIYFLGKNTAQNSIVRCGNYSQCNIFCMGYGSCFGFNLECESKANCTVRCDSTTDCPQISGPYEVTTDIFWRSVSTSHPTLYPTYYPTDNPTRSPTSSTSTSTSTTTVSPETTEMETTEMETTTEIFIPDIETTDDDLIMVPCWNNKCGATTSIFAVSSVQLQCDSSNDELVLKTYFNSNDCSGSSFTNEFAGQEEDCSCNDVIIVSYNTYSSNDCSGQPNTNVTDYPRSFSKQGNICAQFPVGECKPIGLTGASQMMTKCEFVTGNNEGIDVSTTTVSNPTIPSATGNDLSSFGFKVDSRLVMGVVLVHVVYWVLEQ